MSSAGVVVDNGQFAQDSPCRAPSGQGVFEFSKLGITFASFFARMTVVELLGVFMDLDAFFADGDVSRVVVNPAARIVVVDSVFVAVQGGMGVSTEKSRGLIIACLCQGAIRNFS